MTEFGLTVDPDVLKFLPSNELNVPWRRLSLRPGHRPTDWRPLYTHHAAGLGCKVLGVLDADSFPWGWDSHSVYDVIQDVTRLYHLDALQVGNEPDLVSGSSWTMFPREFETLCWDVRTALYSTALPDLPLIGGGLASGHPEYLNGLDLSVLGAIAIHPYGRSPRDYKGPGAPFGTLDEIVSDYQRGWPVWITEFGARSDEIGRRWQGQYIRRFCENVIALEVPVALVFCASDSMVPGYGLYDENGRPKPAARAFKFVTYE